MNSIDLDAEINLVIDQDASAADIQAVNKLNDEEGLFKKDFSVVVASIDSIEAANKASIAVMTEKKMSVETSQEEGLEGVVAESLKNLLKLVKKSSKKKVAICQSDQVLKKRRLN